MLFLECYGYHRDRHVLTHSFPTRRSSDLAWAVTGPAAIAKHCANRRVWCSMTARTMVGWRKWRPVAGSVTWSTRPPRTWRSEEHTSELQSLMRISYAVFCLTKKQDITHQDESSHYYNRIEHIYTQI